MKQVKTKGLGEQEDGIWCGGLMYADDNTIVLVAERARECPGDINCGGRL